MLPIHLLEDIKKHGEALALKEKELLQLRQSSKQYNASLENANQQLETQRDELKQSETNLMQIQTENIFKENIDLKAVVEQSNAIDQQEMQLKKDISTVNKEIVENEQTYREKCRYLSMQFGSLSQCKVENRRSEIEKEYQSSLDQKKDLQSKIDFVQNIMNEKDTLEAEVEKTRTFGKFVQDEIVNCNECIASLQEETKSLSLKRDKIKATDYNKSLSEMEEKADDLRLKLSAQFNRSNKDTSSTIVPEAEKTSKKAPRTRSLKKNTKKPTVADEQKSKKATPLNSSNEDNLTNISEPVKTPKKGKISDYFSSSSNDSNSINELGLKRNDKELGLKRNNNAAKKFRFVPQEDLMVKGQENLMGSVKKM